MTTPYAGAGALALQKSTGAAGFALQNATPTILSWTAPNDGQIHRIQTFIIENVSVANTGGALSLTATDPGGNALNTQLDAGTHGVSEVQPSNKLIPIGPGSTVSIVQSSAQTAGAATVWAEIWGS